MSNFNMNWLLPPPNLFDISTSNRKVNPCTVQPDPAFMCETDSDVSKASQYTNIAEAAEQDSSCYCKAEIMEPEDMSRQLFTVKWREMLTISRYFGMEVPTDSTLFSTWSSSAEASLTSMNLNLEKVCRQ